MPRFCAVYLPRVRVELARQNETASELSPLAVVIARPGGAVQKETDLLGNTRLDEISAEARAVGVRPGQTIAAARAKYAELRVRVVGIDAVRGVLAGVAEMALGFGRTTSFDVAADVVWIDVTGCAHLVGGEDPLLALLAERVRAMGHESRVAIADGPRVAAAVARWGRGRGDLGEVVPPGQNAEAMAALPLAALPLDDEARAWLGHVGMRRVGDLQRLPRESLGTRLGKQAHVVMPLLEGIDTFALDAHRPPEIPEERAELEYGVSSTEALLFVAKTLCDRMAARLEGRGMAASRLELVFTLDRAMLPEGAAPISRLELSLPAPIARAADLLAVLRAKLESSDREQAAPILAATLRIVELSRCEARTLGLFVAEAKADGALPRLVAELSAELGDDKVGTLELCDTWILEERSRLVPLSRHARNARRARHEEVSATTEPSRLLPAPVPIGAADVKQARLILRFEAVEWWRRGVGARDLIAGWVDVALACIEIDRQTGAMSVRGWMD